MKLVLLLCVFFGGAGILPAIVVQSTPAGGNWTAGSTWVGGVVPGPAHNVLIVGPVYVNNHITVNNLAIGETGTLMNAPGANWTITSNQDFTG